MTNGSFVFGRLESTGTMILDGVLIGWLITNSNITTGENSVLVGGVLARRLVNFGQIVGRVVGTNHIQLKTGSTVIGPFMTHGGQLVVEDGTTLHVDLEPEAFRTLLNRYEPAHDAARFYLAHVIGSPWRGMNSLVAKGITICGDVRCAGDVFFDGTLKGGRLVADRLTLGENAKVAGDCVANAIAVYGTVEGNLFARTECELAPGSRVRGGIRTAHCARASNACLNGSVVEGLGDEQFLKSVAKLRNR